jgi:hypothetical protein
MKKRGYPNEKKNAKKRPQWPPSRGRSRKGIVRRMVLTNSERANIYWAGICSCYPLTERFLGEILDSVPPKMLCLWISGSPPFLLSKIEKKLACQKGDKNG